MPTNPDRAPNCLQCVHFRVTWDPAFPRSCTMFDIKTRVLPSAEVCDTADNNCNGDVDEGTPCLDAGAADPAKGGCGCASGGGFAGWLSVGLALAVAAARRERSRDA